MTRFTANVWLVLSSCLPQERCHPETHLWALGPSFSGSCRGEINKEIQQKQTPVLSSLSVRVINKILTDTRRVILVQCAGVFAQKDASPGSLSKSLAHTLVFGSESRRCVLSVENKRRQRDVSAGSRIDLQ